MVSASGTTCGLRTPVESSSYPLLNPDEGIEGALFCRLNLI